MNLVATTPLILALLFLLIVVVAGAFFVGLVTLLMLLGAYLAYRQTPRPMRTRLGPPVPRQSTWIFGAAASFVGALGVFGLQDAASFLIAWEIMSLGGAVMILGENLTIDRGRPVLFMLALLEAGAVALILAVKPTGLFGRE